MRVAKRRPFEKLTSKPRMNAGRYSAFNPVNRLWLVTHKLPLQFLLCHRLHDGRRRHLQGSPTTELAVCWAAKGLAVEELRVRSIEAWLIYDP